MVVLSRPLGTERTTGREPACPLREQRNYMLHRQAPPLAAQAAYALALHRQHVYTRRRHHILTLKRKYGQTLRWHPT